MIYLQRKLSKREKNKAAKEVGNYCFELWKKCKEQGTTTFISQDNSDGNESRTLSDILSPFLGELPPMSHPSRTYWIGCKYEICRLAYEDYLKSQQLWIQSIPYNGIHIRDKLEIKESIRLINNIRRLVNHALELNADINFDNYLPISVKDQYRINRNMQLEIFLSIKDSIEQSELLLDPDTQDLFIKLKNKIKKYISE